MKHLYCSLLLLFVCVTVTAQKFEYTYHGITFKCKVTGIDNAVTITGFPVKSTKVVIPAFVTYRNNTYAVKKISTFLNGVNYLAESLVLEEGIEEIDRYSFNEFRNLTSITLPSTLKHIGRYAIRNNDGMKLNIASNIDEATIRAGKEIRLATDTQERQEPTVAHKPLVTPDELTIPNKEVHKEEIQSDVASTIKDKTQSMTIVDRRKQKRTNTSSVPDVDIDIPVNRINNIDTYCIIIANENYSDIPNVDYARRDGEIFYEYCLKTLGIPEKHIKTFYDATYTTLKRAVNWMETTADVAGRRAKLLLYYAGHGMPGEKDQMAYLIPTDGIPQDMTTCYKLSELYSRLGKINAQSITVFMDACFCGMKRGEDKPLLSARGVAIEVKNEVLSGNTIVFSAASGDETAMAYKEKKHGLFTYFLLEKLRETEGKISFGELFESVSSAVKKNSWLENEKLQSPSVNVSQNMMNTWKELQF